MAAGTERRAPRGVVLVNLGTGGGGGPRRWVPLAQQARPRGGVTLLRFVVAALAMAPFVRFERRVVRAGIELGMWLGAGYVTQAIGLRHTSVGPPAFISHKLLI